MKKLKLPPTIQTPEYGDIPKNPDVLVMIERRKTANIIEGYTLINKFDSPRLYSFYSEINVDNDKLWALIKALVVSFPDNVALIYQYIDDDEPKYGCYVDKFDLINKLNKYEIELIQDGYFHFGIISHTEEILQEIFINRTKYIQYWGIDELLFKDVMNQFDLYLSTNLNFIDEYPIQTSVLRYINPVVTETIDILNDFESTFGNEQSI